jgi:hypothetical protein
MNRVMVIAAVCLVGAASCLWAADENKSPASASTITPTTAPAALTTAPAPTGPLVMPAATTAEAPAATKPAEPATKAIEPAPATKPAEPATATAKAVQAPKPAPKKLDVFAHGKVITVVPDQEIVVELRAASDTPWTLVKIDGASLTQTGKIEFKPKTEGAKEGACTATFKAGKEGKTVVTMERTDKDLKDGSKKVEFRFTAVVAAGA